MNISSSRIILESLADDAYRALESMQSSQKLILNYLQCRNWNYNLAVFILQLIYHC